MDIGDPLKGFVTVTRAVSGVRKSGARIGRVINPPADFDIYDVCECICHSESVLFSVQYCDSDGEPSCDCECAPGLSTERSALQPTRMLRNGLLLASLHRHAAVGFVKAGVTPDALTVLCVRDASGARRNFPLIEPLDVEALLVHCKASGYGDLTTQTTRFDPTVRSAMELQHKHVAAAGEAHFTFEIVGTRGTSSGCPSPNFTSLVASQASALLYKPLHVPSRYDTGGRRGLRAVPHKLSVYGPGGHFKLHVDAPVGDRAAMIGTAVVCLPSRFKGGALVIHPPGLQSGTAPLASAAPVRTDAVLDHDCAQAPAGAGAAAVGTGSDRDGSLGESGVCQWGEVHLPPGIGAWTYGSYIPKDASLHMAAFYGDCPHEVEPVTEGYRVTLSFALYDDQFAKDVSIPNATGGTADADTVSRSGAGSASAVATAAAAELAAAVTTVVEPPSHGAGSDLAPAAAAVGGAGAASSAAAPPLALNDSDAAAPDLELKTPSGTAALAAAAAAGLAVDALAAVPVPGCGLAVSKACSAIAAWVKRSFQREQARIASGYQAGWTVAVSRRGHGRRDDDECDVGRPIGFILQHGYTMTALNDDAPCLKGADRMLLHTLRTTDLGGAAVHVRPVVYRYQKEKQYCGDVTFLCSSVFSFTPEDLDALRAGKQAPMPMLTLRNAQSQAQAQDRVGIQQGTLAATSLGAHLGSQAAAGDTVTAGSGPAAAGQSGSTHGGAGAEAAVARHSGQTAAPSSTAAPATATAAASGSNAPVADHDDDSVDDAHDAADDDSVDADDLEPQAALAAATASATAGATVASATAEDLPSAATAPSQGPTRSRRVPLPPDIRFVQLAVDRLPILKKRFHASVEHTGNESAPSDDLQIYLAGAIIVVPPESVTPAAAARLARRPVDYGELFEQGHREYSDRDDEEEQAAARGSSDSE